MCLTEDATNTTNFTLLRICRATSCWALKLFIMLWFRKPQLYTAKELVKFYLKHLFCFPRLNGKRHNVFNCVILKIKQRLDPFCWIPSYFNRILEHRGHKWFQISYYCDDNIYKQWSWWEISTIVRGKRIVKSSWRLFLKDLSLNNMYSFSRHSTGQNS